VIALLAIAAVSLALFVRVETRVSQPLIDLRLLQKPTVLGADLVIFCAQFTKLAVLVFGALFLQDRLGMSPLLAGTVLLAALIPVMLTAVWSGRLTDRYGSRVPTLAGVLGTGVALAWIAVAALGESYVLLLPGLVLWGIALPFVFNPPITAVLNSVVPENRGQAAGVATTGRQLGGVLAVAVLGAVLIGSDNYALVFALAAGVTFAVGVAAYLLIERVGGPRMLTAPAESRAR
jgi:predicted MFS family arabinose efflux permease